MGDAIHACADNTHEPNLNLQFPSTHVQVQVQVHSDRGNGQRIMDGD